MTMSMAQGICEAQDRNVYGYDDLKKVITFLAVSEVSYLSKEYMENGTYETEEGVFSIRPKEKERFGTLKEAKEFVQSQYLVWVLDGGSLKRYYDDDDQTSPQRFLAVLYHCCGDWDIEAAPDYMKKVNHWKPAE